MKRFDRLCPWLGGALEQLEAAALGGRLGHGWLISGARGTGKANLAYVLGDRLLFGRIGTAMPAAASAEEVLASYAALAQGIDLHPDLHRVRPEEGKRTIAVEQIRGVTEELALTPHMAGLKLVVIEHADRMTTEAANALLKSLEEPTPNTYLLLLAERPGRLLPTVRSRCQQLPLKPPPPALTRQWLGASGTPIERWPPGLVRQAPIAAATLLMDDELLSNYKILTNTIKAFYEGKADPHTVAEDWHRGDTEMALACLIESLQAAIRGRLVPGLSNPITDSAGPLADNPGQEIATDALFAGLRMAENLREQLGRGINVELALQALLRGIEPPRGQRVNT
jgi:DNA polymerase-3 subunit delta'